jgi:anti-sigma regulatory factor (Ser/Thr protein kinase)
MALRVNGDSDWQGAESRTVSLPSDLKAAGVAREACRTTLMSWSLSHLTRTAELVVSELVGNAVKYGRPPVRLLLRHRGRLIRVDVHDERPDTTPRLGPQEHRPAVPHDAEGGRGLLIVAAASDESGVDQVPGDGKQVWAVLSEPL